MSNWKYININMSPNQSIIGYTFEIVMRNASSLERKYPRDKARRIAHAFARQCYFAEFPEGVLPDWLQVKKRGTAKYYDSRGVAINMFPRAPKPWIENNSTLYADRPSRKEHRPLGVNTHA